jgi:hypothetical protein
MDGGEQRRASLNGFHSKYTDGVYIKWNREEREIQQQR